MNKDYYKLISEAKSYYEGRSFETRNIRNGKDVYDLIWCEGLVEEINLWTYWQGAGVEYPEVMIVGQDFGNCKDFFYKTCVESKPCEKEKISRAYIDFIRSDSRNKTDNMLLELTEKGLGEKYSAKTPGNRFLYMTNLCLGYRSVEKISGGDLNAYLKHDSLYISRLINIKKPKIVICLGLDTYFNLLAAFEDDKNELAKVTVDFWKYLDMGKNYKIITSEDFGFRMYGVSHAGSNGAMNRKKNCTLEKAEILSGKELMIEDWKRIGKFLSK